MQDAGLFEIAGGGARLVCGAVTMRRAAVRASGMWMQRPACSSRSLCQDFAEDAHNCQLTGVASPAAETGHSTSHALGPWPAQPHVIPHLLNLMKQHARSSRPTHAPDVAAQRAHRVPVIAHVR